MKKLFSKKNIKDFVIITFGAFLAAVALYFFMLPSNVVVGSASALAMVISNFVPLQVSVINLVLNIILLIIGFILVGSEFGAKTVYTAIVVPFFTGIFEVAFPNFQSLTQDPVLDTLCYVLLVSIAMAILFSSNASSGGLDIVAKIINKFMHIELGKAYSILGIAVALTSAFCYDTKTVILSVLGTYFGGVVVDYFIFGLDPKRRVSIISPKVDEFVDYILHDLNSGATLNEITGAYDNTTRQEIITIVDNNEYRKLMDFVRKTDPKAFVTVYSVSEIQYQPKVRNKERDK